MAIDSTTASSVIDSARGKIAGAIKQAADSPGASFDYLISTAKIESNLDPNAKASTSSARGLYQFIEQTWLGTVKQAGAAFGYGNYANAISQSPSGTYSVNDPTTRDQILKLRDEFPCPVGYSGHEVGLIPSVVAVAMGACVVERHITLDRAMWGSDQAASVEPQGFERLVKYIRVTEASLGDGVKQVYESERSSLKKLRRFQ